LISVANLPVESEIGPVKDSASTVPNQNGVPTAGGVGAPLLIPIDAIRPNPHQPRRTINDASIAELAASMRSSGIIQPLVVRRTDRGFELIAGHRRWRAAKLAGLTEVPAFSRDVDSYEQAQMALVENIQREDLNPIERAQAYRALMDQLGLTQAELATRMGEDRSSIANYLRLLDLTEAVRVMVRDGRLSLGHAKLLAGVADILQQQRLAETVIAQGLSVRGLERMLQSEPTGKPLRKAPAVSAHLADLEKSLARQLGLRVQIWSNTKGRGRLILHYGSLDQFDEIVHKLGGKPE
jgi:ParB family chromosome partitioning protein